MRYGNGRPDAFGRNPVRLLAWGTNKLLPQSNQFGTLKLDEPTDADKLEPSSYDWYFQPQLDTHNSKPTLGSSTIWKLKNAYGDEFLRNQQQYDGVYKLKVSDTGQVLHFYLEQVFPKDPFPNEG